tara:strand:+ start:1001 stop:1366 length:366 start_codon:yes stop_codon:yes gene_type:complete
MAIGMQSSRKKRALLGSSKGRRDREMAYIYLRTCRQKNAPEGQWCRAGIYRCAKLYHRERITVRKCISKVVEDGRNPQLSKALAPWVPSAKPFVAGTSADRRYLKLDHDTLLKALSDLIRE